MANTMTNTLPETLDEAEALAFARVWIKRVGGAAFFESGRGPLDLAASHWFVRRLIRLAIESGPSGAARIVEYAVHGSPVADLALQEAIDEKVNRNEPLDAVLGADEIRARHSEIHHRSGKSPVDHLMQDIAITTLVLQLVERFPPMKPTRSQSGWKRRPSACSIVHQVLTDIKLHRGSEEAIQKVWRRLGPTIATDYAWPELGQRSLGFER